MPWASTSGEAPAPLAHDAAAAGSWRASAARAALACLLLAGLFWGFSRVGDSGPKLHGHALRPRPAPVFAGLLDTQGKPYAWKAQRGHPVLVFFGYTHCPDVCPLTLVRLARVLDQLGARGRDVHVVFVTLDPMRDTPPVLRAYLDALLPAARGLRGDAGSTARAAAQWGVRWRRVSDPGQPADRADYWIDHTAAVTLVGPHGRLRARYGYAQLAAHGLLLQDLRTMLRHAGASGAGA